jgi:hypothetical protein
MLVVRFEVELRQDLTISDFVLELVQVAFDLDFEFLSVLLVEKFCFCNIGVSTLFPIAKLHCTEGEGLNVTNGSPAKKGSQCFDSTFVASNFLFQKFEVFLSKGKKLVSFLHFIGFSIKFSIYLCGLVNGEILFIKLPLQNDFELF